MTNRVGYLQDKDANTIYPTAYPVGAVYISSTNTNPSTLFGGTWELIDKEFKHWRGNLPFTPINCVTATNYGYASRSGHILRFRLDFTSSVDLADTTVELGTIDFEQLGVSGAYFNFIQVPAMTDGGAGMINCSIVIDTGKVTSNDVILKGTNTVLTYHERATINCELPLLYDNMIDSFCDKFYWKRTA